jgi:predicted ATP-binding protein involved in virulence
MRIRDLTVTNYRPFENSGFGFTRQFAAIAGVNGRGKTSILDAVALCLSRLLPQITEARGGQRYLNDGDIRGDEESIHIRISLTCAGYPIDNFEVTFRRGDRVPRATPLSKQLRDHIKNLYRLENETFSFSIPIAAYYTTDRAGFRRPKALPNTVPKGHHAAYHGALCSRTVSYRDLMARLAAITVAEQTEPVAARRHHGERILATIQDALPRFLDGFGNFQLRTQPLRLLVNKNRVPLEIGQLSDGERSFLAMVCDLCRRLVLANPSLPNPLAGEGVVLIDELELHLHPSWQREVVTKLRETFPQIQFITTTHSPFIIQSLNPGELVNLDPEEFPVEYADQSIEDISEKVMGVDLPQKSERYKLMMTAAETYFKLLRESQTLTGEELEAAKRRLDELSAPFSDDPAYQALLKVERQTTLGGDDAPG